MAASALAQIGSPEAKAVIPVLIEVLKDKNVDAKYPNTRRLAAVVLGNFRSEASVVIPALIEALEDQNYNVRNDAAYTLGRMGRDANAAVPALVTALIYELNGQLRQYRQAGSSTPSRDRRRYSPKATLTALGLIAPNPSEAVPALVPALVIAARRQPNRKATDALRKIYPLVLEFGRPRMTPRETQAAASRVIPRLIEALDHQDPLIREGAAEAIGLTGPPAKTAVAALTKTLEEENGEIRVVAALAIWRVDARTKAALPILIEALNGEDVSVRYTAVQALPRLRKAMRHLDICLHGWKAAPWRRHKWNHGTTEREWRARALCYV